jgi:hypothetical protein
MRTERDTQAPHRGCAVRLATNDEEQRALDDYLDRHGPAHVVEFAAKDDDDLDAELCAGRFDRVVFADLNALLSAIWKDHAHVDRWVDAGVSIELATPPPGDSSAWQAGVLHMFASLTRWRRQQRRRQIIAAVILSALALVALAVLFYLVSPAA